MKLTTEQAFQLEKMIKRFNTYEKMTKAFGNIYIFEKNGKKKCVYCDEDTFCAFKTRVSA